jgi:putative DNA primase/helicase
MVHAYRGVGKTRFTQGLGVAIASGGDFLRYTCPKPRGVLLVDGELPREQLQEMLASQLAGAATEPTAPFKILSADMLDHRFPSLATIRGQAIVDDSLEGVEVVILDNISTLFYETAAENEAESWEPAQRWLLDLRRRGLTVLLIHHEGKGGKQRGTSKREDVLSQVVQLKQPGDYTPELGCRFEVHLTKARGVFGEAAAPFEAEMTTDKKGRAVWTWRPLEESTKRQVLGLYTQGVTKQRDIAEELGIGLGTVNRKIRELRQEGLLTQGAAE